MPNLPIARITPSNFNAISLDCAGPFKIKNVNYARIKANVKTARKLLKTAKRMVQPKRYGYVYSSVTHQEGTSGTLARLKLKGFIIIDKKNG